MGKRMGAVIAVVVAVVAVGVGLWMWGGSSVQAGDGRPTTTTDSAPATTTTDVPATDSGREYDGPPNHRDNRGALQPKDMTDEAKTRIGAEAERLKPALVPLQGTATMESVTEVLVAAGYPRDTIATSEKITYDTRGTGIVFGIPRPGGCLQGSVWGDHVITAVNGPVAEWGCLPPDTH